MKITGVLKRIIGEVYGNRTMGRKVSIIYQGLNVTQLYIYGCTISCCLHLPVDPFPGTMYISLGTKLFSMGMRARNGVWEQFPHSKGSSAPWSEFGSQTLPSGRGENGERKGGNSTLTRIHGCIVTVSVDEGKRECRVSASHEQNFVWTQRTCGFTCVR